MIMNIQHVKNLQDTYKTVLTGKVIALNAYSKKNEGLKINDLRFHTLEIYKEKNKVNQK